MSVSASSFFVPIGKCRSTVIPIHVNKPKIQHRANIIRRYLCLFCSLGLLNSNYFERQAWCLIYLFIYLMLQFSLYSAMRLQQKDGGS